MEEEKSLLELLEVLKKYLWLIILTTTITTIIAVVYTVFIVTPLYGASTQLIVTQASAGSQNFSQSDINTSISLISTYEDIIRNDVILIPVIERLNLEVSPDALRNQIYVVSDSTSQVFSIHVEDVDPFVATDISNTIADTFQKEIFDIMSINNVTIISEANVNMNPVSPSTIRNLTSGIVAGIMISLVFIFIRELTDNTVKTMEYVEEETGWINLGQVNLFSKKDLMVKAPTSGIFNPPKSSTKNKADTRERV